MHQNTFNSSDRNQDHIYRPRPKKKKKGPIKTVIMLDKTLREIEVKTNELA
jgi:hypothetical protein